MVGMETQEYLTQGKAIECKGTPYRLLIIAWPAPVPRCFTSAKDPIPQPLPLGRAFSPTSSRGF